VDETSTARVEVLWRPGCSFCSSLRRGLRRAGIETAEHNIWSDPAAAARVRAATGGDETVPTVVVGSRALVNPTVPQVVATLRAEFPDDADALIGRKPDPGPRSLPSGAGWTAVLALAWVLLAVWQPTTTWHLAPVLLGGAWPWVTGQDLRPGARSALGRLLLSVAAGLAATAVVTIGLDRVELLRGPTVLGFDTAAAEAIVLGGAAAVLAALAALPRLMRRPVGRSAWVGEQRVASSSDVVVVEGNAYFPMSDVRPGVLHPTSTRTVCPWKGMARYYTVRADGVELTDAAWCYQHPLPLARSIKGRIAFWNGVDVRVD
jgi:uncharacterized protein (DUF427 family)/glutaredoxin